MATLYIRDVPDDVADVIRARAAQDGQSLSAYVGAQLARLAARPTNAEVVARLRERAAVDPPTTDDIVEAVWSGRR